MPAALAFAHGPERPVVSRRNRGGDAATRPATKRQARAEDIQNRVCCCYRVSTERQGRSGLGLDARRAAVMAHIGRPDLLAEFTEVETGKRDDRPQLAAAPRHCRLTNSVLVIAKLDRLSRNAGFLLALRDGGVRFVCADMPDANSLTIGIMSLIAQHEREAISARTKEALAAWKARNPDHRLGNPNGFKPGVSGAKEAGAAVAKSADAFALGLADIVVPLRDAGLTLQTIADRLAAMHIKTARGGAWAPATVKNLLDRLAARPPAHS